MAKTRKPGIFVNRCFIQDSQGLTLLVQRASTDSFQPSLWGLPGGKADSTDANPAEALQREIHEETGLQLEALSPSIHTESFPLHDGKYAGRPYTLNVYLGKVIDTEVILSEEHDGFVWERRGRLLSYDLTPETRKAILTIGKLSLTDLPDTW